MATTDLHAHVCPYDYCADRPVDTAGLARTATHVRNLRAAAPNAVLLDNGDFLQGTALGDYAAEVRVVTDGAPHPVVAAMNTLGVDAATLGNHDLNYGLGFLQDALAGAGFPVVTANLAGIPGVRPYVLLDRMLTDGAGQTHPIRIGLIGFVPPQVVKWDRRHLEGRVTVRDIVDTARARVPEMKARGADIVIALCHAGIGADAHAAGMENAAVPLAAVPGIDALVAGHQHLRFPGPDFQPSGRVDPARGTLHGKPAVMAGSAGSDLGVIELMLARRGAGWAVVDHDAVLRPIAKTGAAARPVPQVESDPAVMAAVARDHAATLAHVRRPVGRTTVPLHSYFALLADAPAVQLVAEAQRAFVARALRGTAHEDLPILSAASPGKAGGRGGPDHYTHVPAGQIARRHVADLYPFPNTVRAVRVTGAGIAAWLERAAGVFNRVLPGTADAQLLAPDAPSYNFDVIHGLRYRIDLSQPARYDHDGVLVNPAASRIAELSFGGVPVDPRQAFIVATNSYRAGGGGNFPGLADAEVILAAPETNRDILQRFIAGQASIAPVATGTWGFVPMPGTTVLFDSGPGAGAYLDDLGAVRIAPAGTTPAGFARFRVTL